MGAYLTLLTLSAAALAQTTPGAAPEAARYAVVYVDVQPSRVREMRTAFDRYVQASRADAGFSHIELLEQTGKPGSFVVVETWRDQAAIDAHRTSAPRKQFTDALAPIRVSGFDERPYKAIAVGRQVNPRGAPVYVVTHVDIAPPGDATTLLRQFAEESRRDPDCLRFDVLQHADRANHFTIIEAWRNASARNAHAAAPYARRYRDQLQPLIGSPLDERLMQ